MFFTRLNFIIIYIREDIFQLRFTSLGVWNRVGIVINITIEEIVLNVFAGLLPFVKHEVVIIVGGDDGHFAVPIDIELGDTRFVWKDIAHHVFELHCLR